MKTLRDFVDSRESVKGCVFASSNQYPGYSRGFVYEAQSYDFDFNLGMSVIRMQVLTTPHRFGEPVGQRYPLAVCLNDVFVGRADNTNL